MEQKFVSNKQNLSTQTFTIRLVMTYFTAAPLPFLTTNAAPFLAFPVVRTVNAIDSVHNTIVTNIIRIHTVNKNAEHATVRSGSEGGYFMWKMI